MRRRQCLLCLSGLLAAGCAGGSPWFASGTAPSTTITLSAAASLQDALEAIAPQFKAAHPDIAVDYNFGASGALQRQIERGAPVDVFFSAAAKQMDDLAEQGLLVPNSRRDVLSNSLVLIAPEASALAATDLAQLKEISIRHFAVGEFRSVPAGQYAEQALSSLGLIEALQPKFVFGNSVRSVLAAVESGNAEMGLVYATDAALSERVKVLATVPASTHQPIVYPVAVIKASPRPEAAQAFVAFLTTSAAQQTFAEYGFGKP
ncbi:MAG: molybdate ABC transporter substrate-binding protein [Nodosilinea sp.]